MYVGRMTFSGPFHADGTPEYRLTHAGSTSESFRPTYFGQHRLLNTFRYLGEIYCSVDIETKIQSLHQLTIDYTLDCKLIKMSTHTESVSTTLKRRRAQIDEPISNEIDPMNYPAAGLRRLLESGDGWEDSELPHLIVSSNYTLPLCGDGDSNNVIA